MAGEARRVYGTQFTMSSGSDPAIANAAVGTPGGTLNPYLTAQTADFPNLALVLTCAFGTTPNQNGAINVHVVPQNLDGAGVDARDISASYQPYWRGSFIVDSQSTSQNYYCELFDVPKDGKVMLFNNAGAQISANYVLKATPFTLGPAP